MVGTGKAIDKEKLPQPILTFDWLSESRQPDGRHFDSKSLLIMALIMLNSM